MADILVLDNFNNKTGIGLSVNPLCKLCLSLCLSLNYVCHCMNCNCSGDTGIVQERKQVREKREEKTDYQGLQEAQAQSFEQEWQKKAPIYAKAGGDDYYMTFRDFLVKNFD